MPQQEIPNALTDQEVQRMKSIITQHGSPIEQAYLYFMLFYGVRVGELKLIKLEDIDLENNSVKLTRLKNGITNIWPLDREVKEKIVHYLNDRPADTNPFLFRGRFSSTGITERTVRRKFVKYAALADVHPSRRHPHAARHYVAVHALDVGLDITEVRDLLGHRAITSTQIYALISNKKRNEAFLKLSSVNSSDNRIPE